MGGTTTMDYDYTGQRVKKYGPLGQVLYPFAGYEIDPDGTKTKFFRAGNELLAAKQSPVVNPEKKLFYHNDHLGGVNVITDITGNRVQLTEYDPWGKVSRSEGNADPSRRFTGQELDPETGLYYYGGRYYDPELARFISPDMFVPQPDNPQSLNRYSYVINNPQRHIDPSGHSFWDIFKHIVNFIRVITALLFIEVAPEYTFLEIASVATSYSDSKNAQKASMILGYMAMASQVGRALFDHFTNPGKVVDVAKEQVVDKVPQGTATHGVQGVYARTLDDAIQFGRQNDLAFVRWNQSSGPLADLIKAGLEKFGVKGALTYAVNGDYRLLAPGASIELHSAGTAVGSNALAMGGVAPRLNVTLNASIVSQSAIDAAAEASGAIIKNNSSWLDAVTYLGRNPFLAPVGVSLIPLIPFTHPCSVACAVPAQR